MMDNSKLSDILAKVEESERETKIQSLWNSIKYKKESLALLYPNQEFDITRFYIELVLQEKDYNKKLTRLASLINTDRQLQAEESDRLEKKLLQKIRYLRSIALKNTDHYLLADCPADKETKQLVIKYRKYLRDLPSLYEKKIIIDASVMSLEEFEASFLNT